MYGTLWYIGSHSVIAVGSIRRRITNRNDFLGREWPLEKDFNSSEALRAVSVIKALFHLDLCDLSVVMVESFVVSQGVKGEFTQIVDIGMAPKILLATGLVRKSIPKLHCDNNLVGNSRERFLL